MKKIILFSLALLSMAAAIAQTTLTLTFNGRDQNNARVQLDNVVIQNVTKGWTEAIFFPDTVYTITVGTGVEDYLLHSGMQVMPNPFEGRTQINIHSAKSESVTINLVDINGKRCAKYSGILSEGNNYFEIELVTPQTYILSVQTADGTRTLKMVNTGSAGRNQITETGVNGNAVQLKSTTAHIFELGDEMRYTGYSQQSNGLIPSTPITQNQYESEDIILHFIVENNAELPIVATVAASNIDINTATTGGNVFSDGGAPVTARGVCYSVTPNPTLSESHTMDGTGTGAFTSSLTNLVENTTYHVRAYATNSAGTAYGNEITFTTETGSSMGNSCPDAPTVTDYDGNIYNTVQIGTQCWTKENMRTTHYANGDPIAEGIIYSSEIPYRYTPDGNAANVTAYGYLYNWPAVMHGDSSSNANPSGIQGICPAGWHVPSAAEWDQLATYVNSQSEFLCGGYNNYIAKALASNIGWNYHNVSDACAVCNNLTLNNATGFSAMPAGESYGTNHYGFGDMAAFSTSTLEDDDEIEMRGFCYDDPDLTQWLCDADGDLEEGISVRCIRGDVNSGDQLPKVITQSVTNISSSSAWCLGNVINSGTATVSARGFCFSTSPHPTIADYHTTDGNGPGAFISIPTGLAEATIYYYRSYATSDLGTAYGSEGSFTTTNPNDGQPCTGISSLTDYDGNVYSTVQIGTQCWMKENLRTTHYANGDECKTPSGSSFNEQAPWRFTPNNNSSNVTSYGYLYNLPAVLHGSIGSTANPSGVRGICPAGWHMPSLAEFQLLSGYLSSRSMYLCNNSSLNIAKSLADSIGWNTDDYSYNGCTIGYNPSQNNTSGFSARPAGDRSGYFGEKACFWTVSTSLNNYYETLNANYLRLDYYSSSITTSSSNNGWYNDYDAFSVRCVRDEFNSYATVPTVTTDSVIIISEEVVSLEGSVLSANGATVTEYGMCWSTSSNPTLASSHRALGDGLGSFSAVVGGFTPGTTYYLRAYATNSVGTGYGNELTFMMPPTDNHGQPCVGIPTVTDHEGNVYNTVQIGNQCWMKENMRCTTSPKGILGNGNSLYYNDTTSIIPLEKRGLLYNWEGAMDTALFTVNTYIPVYNTRGICPEGWHIPSSTEWTTLQNYVNSQSEFQCSNINNYIAKAMAYPYYWKDYDNNCAVGNSSVNNNATGFSIIPAGTYGSSSISGSGNYAYFWSSTTTVHATANPSLQISFNYAKYFSLTYSNATVNDDGELSMYRGCSVRCLRDIEVTTNEATNVTATSATLNGSVTKQSWTTITSRGFEWRRTSDSFYTASNPTSWSTYSTSLTMACNLSGLDPSTSYTYRAFITYGGITYYGNEVTFTTLEAVAPTVTTTDATNVTASSATLNGNISNPDNLTITQRGFEWKKATDSTYTMVNVPTYSTMSRVLNSLDPNTSYTYRAFITYGGVTIYGNDIIFNTLDAVTPTVTTTDATNVTATTSTLHGNISNPDNVTIHSRGFEWKTSTASDYTVTNINATGAAMSHILTGLTANTQYIYRAFVTAMDSTIYGDEVSFTTLETSLEPSVTTSSATNITTTSATLNGTISNPDNVLIFAQGFEWKPANASTYTPLSVTGTTMTYNLTGLTENTQYIYRAFVTTINGTSYGGEIMFTTLSNSTLFFEDFSSIIDSSSTTITNQLNQYTQVPGWTGDWVYPSNGKVKIGKSAQAGYIQTPPIDLSANNGQFLVTFDAKAWPTDNTNLIVAINGVPYTVSGLSTASFNTFSVPFSGGTSSTVVKFQGYQDTKSRFFLDNVIISSYEPGPDTTPPYVASVNPTGSTLVVTFNENLSPASAEATSNYVIDNNVTVTSATLNNNVVTLSVSPAFSDNTYTLIVSNVSDMEGNVMSLPDTITFSYGVGAEFHVANIAALRSKLDYTDVYSNTVSTVEYKLTGDVVVTAVDDYRNRKIIQDATGAIMIDDIDNNLGLLEVGDKVNNIYGTLINYFGFLEFNPTRAYGSLVSAFEYVAPLTITLTQLNDPSFMIQHQAELIKLNNVTFTSTGSFATFNTYGITQNGVSANAVFPYFQDANFIGTVIPTSSVDITGFNFGTSKIGSNMFDFRYFIVPRSLDDINMSIPQYLTENDIDISPNQAGDRITVTLHSDEFQVTELFVFDTSGDLMLSQQIIDDQISVNLQNLPSGNYTLRLSDGKNSVTTKFVKK